MMFLENFISGVLPFSFLLICGIYLTIKTGFSQITRFPESVRLTRLAFKNRKEGSEITSFKAACTALSATAGTGNIAGVASAISIGGAGAIFWMWVSAILGMCIKAVEITLSVLYREKNKDLFVGGPMYYIKNGLGGKFKLLGLVFCCAALPAVFCSGNITQTNAAIVTFCGDGLSKGIWGVLFFVATLVAITGSVKRIASITESLIPLLTVLYIILCMVVIIANHDFFPKAFAMIFEGAFNPKAVTGGAVGSATTCIFIGASRGIFSNEAGLGTSAMAHSAAVDANPRTQGLFGMFEVFIDTIILCTLTALTILCSGVKINYGYNSSTEPVLGALNGFYGSFGGIALSIMMCLFAYASIIGWAFYGKMCTGYLLGNFGNIIFTIIYPFACIVGALFDSAVAWRLSSVCNGIMLCVNLTALLLLSGKAQKYLKRGPRIDRKKNRIGT